MLRQGCGSATVFVTTALKKKNLLSPGHVTARRYALPFFSCPTEWNQTLL